MLTKLLGFLMMIFMENNSLAAADVLGILFRYHQGLFNFERWDQVFHLHLLFENAVNGTLFLPRSHLAGFNV